MKRVLLKQGWRVLSVITAVMWLLKRLRKKMTNEYEMIEEGIAHDMEVDALEKQIKNLKEGVNESLKERDKIVRNKALDEVLSLLDEYKGQMPEGLRKAIIKGVSSLKDEEVI